MNSTHIENILVCQYIRNAKLDFKKYYINFIVLNVIRIPPVFKC